MPSLTSSMQTLQVAIVDDQMVESSETFSVSMTSPNPRVSATVSQNSISIIDNDGKNSNYACMYNLLS